MKPPLLRWDWYRDDNAAARSVGLSFIAMFCAGLLLRSPWLSQTIGYFVLVPSALWFVFQHRNEIGSGLNTSRAYRLIIVGLALYFAVLVAATFAPDNDYLPVGSPLKRLRGILISLACVAAIGATARHFEAFPKLLGRYVAASILIAAIVLLWASHSLGLLGNGRLNGVVGYNWVLNPNAMGAVYAICFSVAVGHVLHGGLEPVERAAVLPVALLILVIVLLTGSRGALLGCAAAVGIAVLALSRRLAAAIVLFMLLLGMVLYLQYPDWVMTLIERGDANRIAIWKHHLASGLEQPWLGRGLNFDIKFVLGDVDPTFEPPQNLTYPLSLQRVELIYTPHNIVMAAFVRGGLLAVLPQLLVWSAALWSCIGAARAGWYVPLLLVATAFTICMVDHEMLAGSFSYYWYLFWLPLGVAAAAANGAGRAAQGLRIDRLEGKPAR